MLSRSMMLLGCAAMASAANLQQWLYVDINGRGPSAPGWGLENNVCTSGKMQSPVAISKPIVDKNLNPLNINYRPIKGFKVANQQANIKVVSNDMGYVVDTNNEDKRYSLTEVVFHAPSEHMLSGGQFDLEMHLVHTLDDTNDNERYKTLIIAVMFSAQGLTPNDNLGFFADLPGLPMPNFRHYVDKDAEFNDKVVTLSSATVDFGGLLTSRAYYTYNGSMTYPPCTEDVKWYVMTDAASLSNEQLTAFRTALGFAAEKSYINTNYEYNFPPFGVHGNNRPVQKLNERSVFAFTDTFPVNGASADDDEAAAFAVGFVGILLSVITIFVASFIIYVTASI